MTLNLRPNAGVAPSVGFGSHRGDAITAAVLGEVVGECMGDERGELPADDEPIRSGIDSSSWRLLPKLPPQLRLPRTLSWTLVASLVSSSSDARSEAPPSEDTTRRTAGLAIGRHRLSESEMAISEIAIELNSAGRSSGCNSRSRRSNRSSGASMSSCAERTFEMMAAPGVAVARSASALA